MSLLFKYRTDVALAGSEGVTYLGCDPGVNSGAIALVAADEHGVLEVLAWGAWQAMAHGFRWNVALERHEVTVEQSAMLHIPARLMARILDRRAVCIGVEGLYVGKNDKDGKRKVSAESVLSIAESVGVIMHQLGEVGTVTGVTRPSKMNWRGPCRWARTEEDEARISIAKSEFLRWVAPKPWDHPETTTAAMPEAVADAANIAAWTAMWDATGRTLETDSAKSKRRARERGAATRAARRGA